MSSFMSESIYNLVPREFVVPVKESMHRSKHDPHGELTGSTLGCKGTTRLLGAGKLRYTEGATFGPPKHLNAIATINKTKENDRDDYRINYQSKRKTALPTAKDAPVIRMRSNKNFVTANAVEVILSVPKDTEIRELNYMKKADYGKNPRYLAKVKDEIDRENRMIDRYVKEQLGEVEREPERFDLYAESERLDLVTQLKLKWDFVNAKYQQITHRGHLETCGQIRRKEQLETELKMLEANIEKISRAGSILIRHSQSHG